MVPEKMKLKLLEKKNKALYNEINGVYESLFKERNKHYDLDKIVKYYFDKQSKNPDLLKSKERNHEISGLKRDIAFIYYCIKCPFYYSAGVGERMSVTHAKELCDLFGIKNRHVISYYINSAKHYYRFYHLYKTMIDDAVSYIKKL